MMAFILVALFLIFLPEILTLVCMAVMELFELLPAALLIAGYVVLLSYFPVTVIALSIVVAFCYWAYEKLQKKDRFINR